MSDDRPRKSWREIDKAKDRSAHRKDEKPSAGEKQSTQRSQKTYRSKLDQLFESGKVGELLEDKEFSDVNSGGQSRIKMLRKITSAEDPKSITKAVDEYLASFELPDDVDVLAKILEHREPDRQKEAMQRLLGLIDEFHPRRMRAFIGRLKFIRDVGDDPEMTDLAVKLLEKVE